MHSTRCCGCGPKEPVRSPVHCAHTVHKTTHQLLRTTATTPNAARHMQQHATCTPEDRQIYLSTAIGLTPGGSGTVNTINT